MPRRSGGRLIDSPLTAALQRAADADVLLVASDYDGTLSPIVAEPANAIPHAAALEAFRSLAGRRDTPCLIISGRSIDVLHHLLGVGSDIELVGNHGVATPSGKDARARIEALSAALDDVAHEVEGVLVERKPTGAALHYRHASQKEEAADRARAVAHRFSARIIEGKAVVEMSIGHGDKGTALEAARRRSGADCVVFVGDDLTDELAFATLTDTDVGIKVGTGETLARHRVDDPDGVAGVLEYLDRLRAATGR